MTLTVKIKNDGNQPGDCVMINGMLYLEDQGYAQMTGNPNDSIVLLQGEEVSCCPPNDHFDSPCRIAHEGQAIMPMPRGRRIKRRKSAKIGTQIRKIIPSKRRKKLDKRKSSRG